MKSTFALLLVCCVACELVYARTFDKCSLVRELKHLRVPQGELRDWVCIAQHESRFSTKAMNINTNKSKDWGLFQINDRYWCDPHDGRATKNVCKVACKDLLTDNIKKAVRCAEIIRRQQGYKAWVAWSKYCQKSKPDISKC